MTVIFESISSNGVGNGDKTVTPPAGIVDGNLLIAYYQFASATIPLTLPVGFTELFGGRVEHSGGAPVFLVGFKIASSESGNYLFTAGSQAISSLAWVGRLSGPNAATPVDAIGNFESTGGTTATCPDIVTTVANTLLLRIGAFRSTGVGPSSSTGPGTEELEVSAASGMYCGVYSIAGPVSPGSTGTALITQSGGVPTMRQFGITITLAPVSTITATQVSERRRQLMSKGRRLVVIIAFPNVTSVSEPIYLVKDPDAGTSVGGPAPGTGPTAQGISNDGWKLYSFDDVGTAYNL